MENVIDISDILELIRSYDAEWRLDLQEMPNQLECGIIQLNPSNRDVITPPSFEKRV